MSLISTRVFFVTRSALFFLSSSTKADSGVRAVAVVFLVSNNPNSCSRKVKKTPVSFGVESFSFTVVLQRSLRSNQLLPFVTSQGGWFVCLFRNQFVQRFGLLIDDDKSGLALYLHAETDLGETRFIVGFQLGFLVVESCRPILWVFGSIGAPMM